MQMTLTSNMQQTKSSYLFHMSRVTPHTHVASVCFLLSYRESYVKSPPAAACNHSQSLLNSKTLKLHVMLGFSYKDAECWCRVIYKAERTVDNIKYYIRINTQGIGTAYMHPILSLNVNLPPQLQFYLRTFFILYFHLFLKVALAFV